MVFDASKVLRTEIVATLFASPMVIWLAFYLADRWWSVNSRPASAWLKCLRWIGWGIGVILVLLSFPWVYVIAVTGFSAGLSIPESWVQRRFAPDVIEHHRDWSTSKIK
jgi:hypothetical protein